MPIQRVPIVTSLDPESVSNNTIAFGAESQNIIYDRYPDGRTYATQRPSLRIAQDPANFTGINSNGRGVYFWDRVNTLVIVNDPSVEFGYGQPIGTIGSGKDPVYFVETPQYLVILDPENNQGWTIDVNSPTSVVAIDDVDFPPLQTPALQLAGGGAYIDGFLFVATTDGNIWNSNINDARAWTATDFIGASREEDVGTFVTKHHDNIVYIGSKTTEFFFNGGNAVGSPLSRRQDISYRTGASDRKSVSVIGDTIMMIASDRQSTNGLYEIKDFRLTKRSSFSIDRSLSLLGIDQDFDFILANAVIDDHFLTFITAVEDDGSPGWVPIKTQIFDSSTSLWTQFAINLNNISQFPVISVADKLVGTERNIELLLTDGNVLEVAGPLTPIDTDASGAYFEEDYLVNNEDYVATVGTFQSANIQMSITLQETDFGVDTLKFLHSLWVVGTFLSNNNFSDQTDIDVSWTDDHYNTFNNPRQLDIATIRKLTRLGRFRRRAFKMDYSGSNTLRIEALEFNVGVSPYA